MIKLKDYGKENERENRKKIEQAILEFLGVYGYAKAGIKFISFEKEKSIISVTTKYVSQVKAALAMQGLGCVGVSGTIKRAREKFLDK